MHELRNCNIDFETNVEEYPELQLELNKDGRLFYQVVVNQEPFARGTIDMSREESGKSLAYQLFKIPR